MIASFGLFMFIYVIFTEKTEGNSGLICGLMTILLIPVILPLCIMYDVVKLCMWVKKKYNGKNETQQQVNFQNTNTDVVHQETS